MIQHSILRKIISRINSITLSLFHWNAHSLSLSLPFPPSLSWSTIMLCKRCHHSYLCRTGSSSCPDWGDILYQNIISCGAMSPLCHGLDHAMVSFHNPISTRPLCCSEEAVHIPLIQYLQHLWTNQSQLPTTLWMFYLLFEWSTLLAYKGSLKDSNYSVAFYLVAVSGYMLCPLALVVNGSRFHFHTVLCHVWSLAHETLA